MLNSMGAAREFGDVIPLFREAWKLAWADIIGRFNEPGWDNRCRSQVIQMQAVIHARELLSGNPDVRHFMIDNRHVFSVRNCGLFRLKQLDENHCTSNYATSAARAFDGQSQLSGLEEYQRFTIGLMPNPDWTDYVGIYMTFPKALRQRPNWVLDITGTPIDVESLQDEFNESVSKPERRFKPLRKQSEERAANIGA